MRIPSGWRPLPARGPVGKAGRRRASARAPGAVCGDSRACSADRGEAERAGKRFGSARLSPHARRRSDSIFTQAVPSARAARPTRRESAFTVCRTAPPCRIVSGQRIDKWLWCARFFKSRSLAAGACNEGRIRVSGQPVSKAHHAVKPGDVLTFAQGPHIRVVRIAALAVRRGPAVEARALYDDLAPPVARQIADPPFDGAAAKKG